MQKHYKNKHSVLEWKRFFINHGEIGHGGNSKIYKVVKKTDKSKKEVALKDPGKLTNIKNKRFLNEIKIVINEQTNFDGILPIIEYSASKDECYWYTMPIAIPIKEKLKDSSEDKIISAILDVAKTLKNLHAKKIFHRDIKPENLFYYNGKFCLGDFGLVHYPESEELTKNNKSLGPWATMAPEMRREPKNYDGEKADIYSLAKTLWILLCKKNNCFDGVYDYNDSSIALNDAEFKHPIVDIHLLLKDCTQHDPDKRPTMADFCNRLQAWLNDKDDYIINQAKEWLFIQNQLFLTPVTSVQWTNLDDIVNILQFVTKRSNLNHLFLPTGGGTDAEKVEKAYEKGHIFIYNIGTVIQLKPKNLYMECFTNPMYNYFLLEADNIEPICRENTNTSREYCAALPNGENIISDGINYGVYNYDSDEKLPQGTLIVNRYTGGKFLFTFKMYGYNSINSTYDARHNDATIQKFRKYMEVLEFTQKLYNDGDDDFREVLDKFYSINPFKQIDKPKKQINKRSVIDNKKNIEEFVAKNFKDWDFSDCIQKYVSINKNFPLHYYVEFRIPDTSFLNCRKQIFDPDKYLCKDGKIKEFKSLNDAAEDILFITSRQNCKEICEFCESKLKAIFDCVDLDIGYGVFFHKELIRNPQVSPSHLFNKAEIMELMKNADDRHYNTLVIDENGFLKIIQDDTEDAFLFPVRNSQWVAGNNYVGRHAFLDENYINDIYMYCLTAWLRYLETGKAQYSSECWINEDEKSLLKSIKNFY